MITFFDNYYTLENKEVDIEGDVFQYDKYLESKEEYNNAWYRDSIEFSLKRFVLGGKVTCNSISRKDGSDIIVSLTDKILILCQPENIIERTDGFYAYDYTKYISSKYLNDKAFIEKNYSIKIQKPFHNTTSLQDNIDADTLKIDIQSWIFDNVKMPQNYSGIIEKGKAVFKIIFNKKGEVFDLKFVNNLDEELNNYLVTELKKMPSVGLLNNNNDSFKEPLITKHVTKQTFTAILKKDKD